MTTPPNDPDDEDDDTTSTTVADGDRLAHARHLTPSRLRREATRIRPSYACSRWGQSGLMHSR